VNGSYADEIDLHRLTVDQALPRLEDFIYDAYQRGLAEVVVVHGKGTGVLKEEVRRYLNGHVLVRSYRVAPPERGGAGATRVILRDE
jgi:DNA mismatch repair protein MutS2